MENDGGDYDTVKKVTIGFSAVPSLIAGKVDAVVAFWNAEGVTLRRRGVKTVEFRVDDYGAPRYPELVLAVERKTLQRRRELVDTMLEAIERGTFKALDDREATVKRLVDASGADEPLMRAQLAAVSRALLPPISLDRPQLEEWAAFEKQFGILKEEPDVQRAFRLR
jgi:putative hydroxymethylpyrimidine transport system substrate-binding protein